MENETSQTNCKGRSPTNNNFSMQKPGFHPRTPSSGSTSTASLPSFMNATAMTPPAKRFHMYSSQQQHKVRNPFEAALAERLHLPMIASPSLFQRPTTPQLSSTQFEWTIEDVSSLKPVHVEPHETQFHDSPDPDYEAKAQSAISSFFKEHQIVPSPVNCPLRQQRILLAEINGNTPIAKPGRRIRDIGTQTALTLPAQLPSELEEALRPYFQPTLALGYDEDGNPSFSKHNTNWLSFNSSGSGCTSGHNVSMRRKLFDIHNIIVLDENRKEQTPKTPKFTARSQQRACAVTAGKLSDSFEKSSPSLTSPTSMSEYYSPNATTSYTNVAQQHQMADIDSDHDGQSRQKRRSFLFRSPNATELSPILPSPKHAKSRAGRSRQKNLQDTNDSTSKNFETPAKFNNRAISNRRRLGTSNDDDETNIEIDSSKFTPDRSSSPLHSFHSSASAGGGGLGGGSSSAEHATTFATESFRRRISRLVVNSAGKSTKSESALKVVAQTHLDTTEIIENVTLDDDDAMVVSQFSIINNSNLSSSSINSHCDTPTGKRRSASRKNLSQSFTANWTTSSDDDSKEADIKLGTHLQHHKMNMVNEIDKNLQPNLLNAPEAEDIVENAIDKDISSNNNQLSKPIHNEQLSQQPSGNFYRTDSGFNEMTSSSTSTALLLLSQQDESSRDAIVLKSSGEVCAEQQKLLTKCDEMNTTTMDISMSTRCSTPTKQQQLLFALEENNSTQTN